VLGSTIGLVSMTMGLLLLIGGKRLHKAGSERERDVQVAALRALATRHGGVVTPAEAARALGTSTQAADQILTDLVKKGEDVKLEVDDDGRLLYLFGGTIAPTRMRVASTERAPQSRIASDGSGENELDPAERSNQNRMRQR
jgi:hypothetical protein